MILQGKKLRKQYREIKKWIYILHSELMWILFTHDNLF